MNMTPPEPLHITYPGPARMLGTAALSLLFVALGVWILWTGESTKHLVAGAVAVIFFSACTIVMLSRLGRAGKDMYVLDEQGVHYADTRCAMIPWSDVEGVEAFTVRNQRFVGLHLRDEKARLKALPATLRLLAEGNKKVGCPAFSLIIWDEETLEQCMAVCEYWLEHSMES